MSSNLPSFSSGESPVRYEPVPGSAVPYAEEPGGGEPPTPGNPLRRYLAAVRRYKWIVVAVTLLAGGAGVVVSRFVPPQYTAQSTLWVEVSGKGDMSSGPIQSGQLLDSYAWLDLLRSFVVLDHVVRDRRLYLEYSPADTAVLASLELKDRFMPGQFRLRVDESGRTFSFATKDGVVIQRGTVGDSVGGEAGFRWLPAAKLLRPGREVNFTVVTPREAAVKLSEKLQIQLAREGNFLKLELSGSDPEAITSTLNAVTERFVGVAGDLKKEKLTELAGILEGQLEYAAENLKSEEIALESFRVQTIILPTDRGSPLAAGVQATRDPVFDNYFNLKLEREQLRRDREAVEQALGRNESGLAVGALEVIPAVQQSSALSLALKQLTEKRAEIRALANRYTSDYPPMRRLEEEVESLEEKSIPQLARRVVSELTAREASIEEITGSVGNQLKDIPPRMIEEARLQRRVAIADNLYQTLQRRYEEARLAAVTSSSDVRVLDEATVPFRPVEDQRMQLILMVLLGGLGLGVVGAVLLDHFDPRLRYPEQVSHGMGLTILGAVPDLRAKKKKGADPTTFAVEAFRSLRLNLTHAYGAAGPLIVTITSPGMGDGKSFVSSNLALAFADLGHRVLLIDGDIRRGVQHKLLNVNRRPGLMDYLADRATREEIVQETAYPSLHVIGSGTRMQNGPELLGSAAMGQLMAELRTGYSVILIDSPPLGAGVDPFILSALSGNVLLALRSGATDREFAEAKLQLLERLPVRILGAVLNGISPNEAAYRYYSYLDGYEATDEGGETEPKQLQGA